MSDVVENEVPWRAEGSRPPRNALFADAATGLHPWTAAWHAHPSEVWASPAIGAVSTGPAAALFGLLSPGALVSFALLPRSLSLLGMAFADALVAFGSFYWWRRRRKDRELAAAAGALVFAFAPARAVFRLWPYGFLVAAAPLFLVAVDAALDGSRAGPARKALAWGGLAALLVLGGHPAVALLVLEFAAAYAIARLVAARGNRPGADRAPGRLVPSAAGSLAALLLLAPCLALGASFLAEGRWLELRAGAASAAPVPWRGLFLLVDPTFYGDPARGTWRGLGWAGPDNLVELNPYLGLATLLVAPLALAGTRRREAAFFLAILAGIGAAIFGLPPFAALARLLPGAGLVFLSRLKLLAALAAAVLVTLGLAKAASLAGRHARLAALGIGAFLALDLSLSLVRFEPFPEKPDAPPRATPALDALREVAPGGGRRFLALDDALPPNLAFDLDLEDVRAHLLHSAGYRDLLARLDPQVFGRKGTRLTLESATFRPDAPTLDLLGVSGLLAPHGARFASAGFVLRREGPDADVWERPWSPPARVVSPSPGADEPSGRVVGFEARRLRWTVTVETDRPGRVLLGRCRRPGVDRVLVDGVEAAPVADARAPGLLALAVGAGRHVVAVDAGPPRAPLAVSAAGGALALLALVASATLSRR